MRDSLGNSRRRLTGLAFLMLFAGCQHASEPALAPGVGSDREIRFAIVGDGPYSIEDETRFSDMAAAIRSRSDLSFVIHVGDIKGGSELCSDALLTRRLTQIESIGRPVVYTPGDNEWTDCHRAAAGKYWPPERLAFLRSSGFAFGWGERTPERQGGFPENQTFRVDGVRVATLHLVGSQDGDVAWDAPDRAQEQKALNAARREATLRWMDQAFEQAEAEAAHTIVLVFHADPDFPAIRTRTAPAPFQVFFDRLAMHAAAFKGDVVIIHGDSHVFRHDKPMFESGPDGQHRMDRLTRIETTGAEDMEWVEVRIPEAGEGVAVIAHRVAS